MAKDKSKKKDVEPEVEETTKKAGKKDKGGKADKSEKKSKGKGDGAFARPSDAPAGGDSWSLTADENVGALMLITPLREEDVDVTIAKRAEVKRVVVADVVVINEKKPLKSEPHEEVYVFGGWLKGALKGYIGERKVLARLVKEKDTSSSTGYVWKFEDADEDDIAAATEYVNSVDVFKAKKGK